ncbi:MAG: GIY-YIG nuclease family protein [Saprospiraceae bacterium]|nr:GIY-YIG nuclease family protein [Saprospiraceae bacterium]
MTKGYGGRSPLETHRFKVYILKCNDGKYYVGKTNDLEDRLNRHSKGQVSFTSSRLPFELITYISFDDEWKAAQMEKYLKSGSGRAFAKRHLH